MAVGGAGKEGKGEVRLEVAAVQVACVRSPCIRSCKTNDLFIIGSCGMAIPDECVVRRRLYDGEWKREQTGEELSDVYGEAMARDSKLGHHQLTRDGILLIN